MKRPAHFSMIEPLEARIAPAAVFTFTDVDGDTVTVKTSKGTTADLQAAAQRVTSGMGEQLQVLDLRDLVKFGGTTVTITATKPDGTASEVNVGYVNATGNDLGAVKIDGDLGAIDAGNPAKTAAAVASLTVMSLGDLGTTTGAPDLQSDFDGALGKLVVAQDVKHAYVKVVDASGKLKANLGAVSIGGDLIGGAVANAGYLYADNLIGAVTIGGDLLGGTADKTGRIASGHPFSTKTGLGAVKILGSLKGSSGVDSGTIFSNSALASLFVGMNLEGGTSSGAGNVFFNEKPASKITIVHDFIGGKIPDGSGGFFNTGEITASGGIGSLFVGGSILGGAVTNLGTAKFGSVTVIGSVEGGDADFSGSIYNRGATGAVKIGGNLKGGAGDETGILYFGTSTGGKVASVTIEGSVLGGAGTISGNIGLFYDAGKISIGGSVVGDVGELSGTINSFGSVGSITIAMNLQGGTGPVSGMINPPASTNFYIGKLEIGGSMIGNIGVRSGSVWSLGTIGTMTVGGSVSSGTGTASGGIRANDTIKSLTVEHDVTGSTTDPVYITGGGVDFFTNQPEASVALGKVVIKGNVVHAKILAGWDAKADQMSAFSHRPAAVNGDASIGSVEVRGSWTAGDIVAGAQDSGGNGFGRNDALITPNVAKSIAKIASVTIFGAGTGSTGIGEYFGIVAEQIGKLSVGGANFVLTSGKDHAEIDIGNHNFAYLEV